MLLGVTEGTVTMEGLAGGGGGHSSPTSSGPSVPPDWQNPTHPSRTSTPRRPSMTVTMAFVPPPQLSCGHSPATLTSLFPDTSGLCPCWTFCLGQPLRQQITLIHPSRLSSNGTSSMKPSLMPPLAPLPHSVTHCLCILPRAWHAGRREEGARYAGANK